MIKPELLEDALKCARIIKPDGDWVTLSGSVVNQKELFAIFDPYLHITDYHDLSKAVFGHQLVTNGAYKIEINYMGYGLFLNGKTIIDNLEADNLTDFLIRALPVLEGK